MKNKKAEKAIYILVSILFWFAVWEILSLAIGLEIVLPSPPKVFGELLALIITIEFWKITLFSVLRILLGFITGIILGILTAILTHYVKPADAILSPFMTVIRATPVASFVLILWIMIGSSSVPAAITILMVTPIVWQNMSDGFSSIDRDLSEVCEAYEISFSERFKILIFPSLKNYLIPGIITSASLGWKSGIAAEIIAYTDYSIGKEILLAKNFFESARMLAWTMIVIILSLIFEGIIKYFGRKYGVKNAKT